MANSPAQTAHGAVSQSTERTATDIVGDVHQLVDVPLLALTSLDATQHLDNPPGTLAARGAFTAGLMLVKLQPAQRDANHRGRFVEALQSFRAEHRLGPSHPLVVEGEVDVVLGQDRGRGTTGGKELQFMSLSHATGDVEKLTQRSAIGASYCPG